MTFEADGGDVAVVPARREVWRLPSEALTRIRHRFDVPSLAL